MMSNQFWSLLNALSVEWSTLIWRACWQGALLVGLIGLCCHAGRNRLPLPLRPWLWRLAALKFLVALLPLATIGLPIGLFLAPPTATVQKAVPDSDGAATGAPSLSVGESLPRGSTELLPATSRINAVVKTPVVPEGLKAPRVENRAMSFSTERSGIVNANRDGSFLLRDNGNLTRRVSQDTGDIPTPQPGFRMENFLVVALLLWLLGVMWSIVRLFNRYRRIHSLLAASKPAHDECLLAIYHDVVACFDAKNSPRLLVMEQGKPMLCGLWRPQIVLPLPLLQTCPDDELRLILAHELAHWRRCDLAWNGLFSLVAVLFFFHPAIWWMRRQWQQAQEMVCDEMALQHVREPVATYGRMLLRVATGEPSWRLEGAAVGVINSYDTLKERLQGLATLGDRGNVVGRRARIAVFVLLGAIGLSLVPWRVIARSPQPQLAAKSSLPNSIRVISAEGKPVGGATVYYNATGQLTTHATASHQPHEQIWKKYVTDSNGYFTLPDSEVRKAGRKTNLQFIMAEAPGHGLKGEIIDSYSSTKLLTIRLHQPSSLHLTLQDSHGRSIANRQVRVTRFYSPSRSIRFIPDVMLQRYTATTDAAGKCVIEGLPRGLRVSLDLNDGRYAEMPSSSSIELRNEREQRTVRFLLSAQLDGRVVLNTTGKPVPALQIQAHLIRAQGSRARDTPIRVKSMRRNPIRGNYHDIGYNSYNTTTDKTGRYTLRNLIPGFYVVATSLSEQQEKAWTPISTTAILKDGKTKRLDFKLIKGAVIEGRVTSAVTGKPIAGQYLGLFDASGNFNRYAVTKADGLYTFRVPGGKQHLWIHGNAISPPAGYTMPEQKSFNFLVRNGQTARYNFKLPKLRDFSIKGQVLGPNGNPVADATVRLGPGAFKVVKTDDRGMFTIDRQKAGEYRKSMLLFAQSGELVTPRGTLALPGEYITLRLESGVLKTCRGRVVDATGNPIKGARVGLDIFYSRVGWEDKKVTTDNFGRFEIGGLHPQMGYSLRAKAAGYDMESTRYPNPSIDFKKEAIVTLQKTDSFVGGRVVDATGAPVSDARISIRMQSVRSDTEGYFRFARTVRGPIVLSVQNKRRVWLWRKAVAGRDDNRVVLDNASLYYDFPVISRETPWNSQIGKIAPPLAVKTWSNSPPVSLASLKGQIVVLKFFDIFLESGMTSYPELDGLSRETKRNIKVISLYSNNTLATQNSEAPNFVMDGVKLRKIALQRNWTFPVALDAPAPANSKPARSTALTRDFSGGLTMSRYHATPGIQFVIGRDGRVYYAGFYAEKMLDTVADLLKKDRKS